MEKNEEEISEGAKQFLEEKNKRRPDVVLPQELKDFIENSNWTFAKTYAAFAPHWYIVRNSYNYEMFIKLITFIRMNGVVRRWYSKIGVYLDFSGHSYWTMGEPLEECNIINRKIQIPEDKLTELPRNVLDESKLPNQEVVLTKSAQIQAQN